MTKISIVESKKDVKQSIKKAVDLIGGMEQFIKKGDTVLVKPNYNSDDPPPASSDPLFVKAVVEMIKAAGAKKIVIGESSGPFWKPTMKVLDKTGLKGVADELGVEIKDFDNLEHVEKKTGSKAKYLKNIRVTSELYKYDKLVYIPCLKTHMNAKFTLALKLCMGFPKTADRLKMHTWKLEEKIAELNLLMKPDIIIMDGRKAFVTQGPHKGKEESPGVVLASTDRVAIDIEAVKILQRYEADNQLGGKRTPPESLPLIKRAIEIGIGKPGESVRG